MSVALDNSTGDTISVAFDDSVDEDAYQADLQGQQEEIDEDDLPAGHYNYTQIIEE